MWRGLQPAASRLVSTPVQFEAQNKVSRHECRDGSLERLRHKVNSAVGTWHDEKCALADHLKDQFALLGGMPGDAKGVFD
jgi:hypothetical protein